MYKEIRQLIQQEKIEKSEGFSEEQVIGFLKEFIEKELQKHVGKNLSEEELRKSLRQAFKTGLTVVGLIHGAHHMGQTGSSESMKAPEARSRSIASEKAPAKARSRRVPGSYKDKKIRNFIRAVHMGEGRKDISQKELDQHSDRAHQLFDTYGGDEQKMAYHWSQGPDFKAESFDDPKHHTYKDSDSVKQYSENRSFIEKNPYKPLPIKTP